MHDRPSPIDKIVKVWLSILSDIALFKAIQDGKEFDYSFWMSEWEKNLLLVRR